jgi:hypothetical protein
MAAGPSNYGRMTTNLDASESSDPNNDTLLTYVWDSGDGITETTSATATSHTHAQGRKCTVTLTVRGSLNRSSEPARIDVFPGDPSKPMVENLADESPFHVDEPITADSSATDPDASDAVDELRWEALPHHDGNHVHLYKGATDSNVTFPGTAPEGLFSVDLNLNYLEVRSSPPAFSASRRRFPSTCGHRQ